MDDLIMYLIPISLIVSFVFGYFAVKYEWKIVDYF